MTDAGLLHSCAVYLYLYDPDNGSYTQQTDAAVGCALLSDASAFSLLLYDTHKTPLLTLPVTPSARFVPQKDQYVNFYERQTQRNFAMRFRDAASSEGFLAAVAYTKAQVLLHSAKTFDQSARGSRPVVLVDQLAIGREDAEPLTLGDVAGVALKTWQGSVEDREGFFSANPLEISKQTTTDATDSGEVRRIRLEEAADDPFVQVLASEALVGMQKAGKRLVTVAFPQTQEWVIAEVELVKVKKNKSAETVESEDAGHEDLVKRMASLSRMGSQSSGLIASVKTRLDSRVEANGGDAAREAALGQSEPPAGYIPVLLAGLQLPGERPGSFRSLPAENNEVQTPVQQETMSALHASSLAAKVIEPLRHSSETTVVGSSTNATSLSVDMERLMIQQSELAQLREQLEERKRKLQSEDVSTSEPSARSPSPSSSKNGTSAHSASLIEYKPAQDKPASSFTPSSFALMGSAALPIGTSSSYGSTTSRWSPPKVDLAPSFTPSAFVPPTQPPTAPSTFSSSLTPYANRSFPSYSSTQGVSGSGSSPDVENGIIRLQRSSTSVESTLQDLQSKMDRLLNMQNSMKSGKFVATSSKYGGGSSFSPASSSSSSSSSSMLLKNLEKALVQRDQLQEVNSRLQEANGELESTVEDLQNQQESLQMENRTLLDKLQNGNHLQQEKSRLELRSVQQQLSVTQEQMLMYQEENFHLRSQLGAKDEQLAKEKAKLQEDTHKQLEQLQRQVEAEVRQGSKDSIERMATEKATLEAQVAEFTAQKKQWDVEREMMNNRLSQAQSQQVQLQDETVKSQAAQNSQAQELISRVQQLEGESRVLKQQAEGFHSEAQHLEELLASKEHEMTQLLSAKNDQEYAALSELFKEFMNDIYFHFQDAFDEDTEFTGKEIVMAIRKILKQNTMDILSKLEEFYQQQSLHRQ